MLGRLASEVAAILRGKHKPIFAPHMDTGDNVIVVNAEKVELTGAKLAKKIAYRHSGYPGGITATKYGVLMAEKPEFVIEKAVRGMLPKNSLGRSMFKKLHVVVGPEHPHQAQQPVPYTLGQPPMWEGLPPRGAEGRLAPADKPAATKPASKPASKKTTATAPAKTTAAKKTAARKPAAKKQALPRPPAKPSADKKPAAKKPAATRSLRPRRTRRSRKWPRPPRRSRPDAARKPSRACALCRGRATSTVNGRTLDDYFPARVHRMVAVAPLRLVGPGEGLRRDRPIHGGGIAGQAGAVRLGIARALIDLDPELRAQLKAEGFLRRDAREKERRKYGLKKARKAPQYRKQLAARLHIALSVPPCVPARPPSAEAISSRIMRAWISRLEGTHRYTGPIRYGPSPSPLSITGMPSASRRPLAR